MEITVWVDGWQLRCCGQPFAIGSAVSWTIADADQDWLERVLGPEAATTVDAAEEHHDGGDLRTVEGTVMSVAAVHCRYAPQTSGTQTVLYPVAGSGTLTQLESADGWTPHSDDHEFAGYLVRLAVAAPCR